MDRIFLDASVLFSAAYRLGSPLRQLWALPDTKLYTSDYAVEEARRNLLGKRPAQVPELEKLLHQVRTARTPVSEGALLAEINLPEKDRPILQAAIGANATHLITSDETHFGPSFGQKIGGVLILPPSDYLDSRSSPT